MLDQRGAGTRSFFVFALGEREVAVFSAICRLIADFFFFSLFFPFLPSLRGSSLFARLLVPPPPRAAGSARFQAFFTARDIFWPSPRPFPFLYQQ